MKKNVSVLFGGKSSEYEVSLSSAYAMLSNINREKYNISMIGITKEGEWNLYTGDIEHIRDGSWCTRTAELCPILISPDNGARRMFAVRDGELSNLAPDVVFPMLHGRFGEDGQIQGMLSVMGVPVVGCMTASSAACMDKATTKAIVSELGVRQARFVILRDGEDFCAAADRAEREFGYPMFVKPACAGSSVGISKAHDREELMRAITLALCEDSKLLIEEMIVGCEVEVAILEERGRCTVSVPAEIDVGSSDFYDYDTKYVSDVSSYYIPARIPDASIDAVWTAAERIFRALDCRTFSRVDFFCTPDGGIVFTEINTIPGFTPISMYPKLMIHEGIAYAELIDRMIESAMG